LAQQLVRAGGDLHMEIQVKDKSGLIVRGLSVSRLETLDEQPRVLVEFETPQMFANQPHQDEVEAPAAQQAAAPNPAEMVESLHGQGFITDREKGYMLGRIAKAHQVEHDNTEEGDTES
jgi:hypothetical protein